MVGMQNSQSPYRMRAENRLPKFESKKNPFAAKNETPKTEPIETPLPATAIAQLQNDSLFDGQLNLISTIPVAAAKSSEPELVPVVVAPAAASPSESKEVIEPVFEQRRIMRPEPKGLVDASPLGLKTGTPTRAPLPAPVIAPAKNPAKQPKPSSPAEPPTKAQENESSQVVASKPAKIEQKSRWFAPFFNFFKFGKRAQKPSARPAVQTELSLDRIKVMRNDLNDADLEVVSIKRSEKSEGPPVRLQPVAETEAGSLGRIASRIFGASESLVR